MDAKCAVDHLDTIADNFEIDIVAKSAEKELEPMLDMMMNDNEKGKQTVLKFQKLFCHSRFAKLETQNQNFVFQIVINVKIGGLI